MAVAKSFVLLYLASVASMASAAESRDLTVCDSLKACFLVNIDTRKEVELTGMDKFVLDPSNSRGYSIRCDVNGNDELDFIKFAYDGITFDEFGEPRYMAGDSNQGSYINKVDYLSTCGVKKVSIQGNVWSNPCFEREYVINVSKGDGTSCDGPPPAPVKPPTKAPVKPPTNAPVNPPTNAPIKPPTKAPVKPPTNAPVKPPTNAPIKPPTNAPVKPPTKAPVKPPTNAPVKPPTKAPVKPPTNAPVKPPTKAPVKPPTKAPVKPPTKAPVKPPTKAPVKPPTNAPVKPAPVPVPAPVCPSGQYWINGCCKPIPTCPYGQQWINGCCQVVCKNDYVCPINSSRIAHRSCYDNFDDCECRYGYYKSYGKCVKYSWCYW